MPMTDAARTFYEEDMIDSTRESIRKLVAEGKLDRARRMIEEKAWQKHELKLSHSDAQAILDEFTTDKPADAATLDHFPDKQDKPEMDMDMHEGITDPAHRNAPNPSNLDTPTTDS